MVRLGKTRACGQQAGLQVWVLWASLWRRLWGPLSDITGSPAQGPPRAGRSFVLTLCLALFQGRAGSDGARGMPGQTGPKVGAVAAPWGPHGRHHPCRRL